MRGRVGGNHTTSTVLRCSSASKPDANEKVGFVRSAVQEGTQRSHERTANTTQELQTRTSVFISTHSLLPARILRTPTGESRKVCVAGDQKQRG
jgi:hypothetical protein